jgi:AraC-like DNA-binding protein
MQIVIQEFEEPGEVTAAVSPARIEIIPTESGRFCENFASLDFPRLTLRSYRESLSRLAHATRPPDRAYIGFLPDETLAPVVVDGLDVDAHAIVQFGSARDSIHRSFSRTGWANLSVSHSDLDALNAGIGGRDLTAGAAPRLLVPDKERLRRLRSLHAGVIALAAHSPEFLAEAELARSVEESVIEVLVDCLTSLEQRRHSPTQLRHTKVLARFREFLEANMDRPLYLPEVCAAVGVSHRALSYCCQDFLGMPPKRYFFLRRMYMARRALVEADRHSATVTEVATRHGFWEFGRFAAQYKVLFGETPSATLRKEKDNLPA